MTAWRIFNNYMVTAILKVVELTLLKNILTITQWMGMNHCFCVSYNVYETTMFNLK